MSTTTAQQRRGKSLAMKFESSGKRMMAIENDYGNDDSNGLVGPMSHSNGININSNPIFHPAGNSSNSSMTIIGNSNSDHSNMNNNNKNNNNNSNSSTKIDLVEGIALPGNTLVGNSGSVAVVGSSSTHFVDHSNSYELYQSGIAHQHHRPVEIVSGNGSSIASVVKVATVRRRWCGTGPFDRYWLNIDCCGLFCALLTYLLHAYGFYVTCLIIIPPWMSHVPQQQLPPISNQINTNLIASRTLSVMGIFHQFAFTTLSLLAVVSHFKAMTTDPGAVPPDAKPLVTDVEDDDKFNHNGSTGGTNEWDSLLAAGGGTSLTSTRPPKVRRLCRRCKTFKPQRAHHCSVCNRCIIKMDHHCPWVNNCVGIGNHKYFLLFVFYTFMTCLYSLALVIVRFSTCVHGFNFHRNPSKRFRMLHPDWQQRQSVAEAALLASGHTFCLDRPGQLMSVLGLIVESLLFGMFTVCMMCDQADVIKSKVTHIDRLKGSAEQHDLINGVSFAGIAEVFGVGRSLETNHKKSSINTNVIFNGNSGNLLGTKFRIDWLSPFVHAWFPPSVHDEIMGFCRPCMPRRTSSMTTVSNHHGSTETELLNVTSPRMERTLRSVEEIL